MPPEASRPLVRALRFAVMRIGFPAVLAVALIEGGLRLSGLGPSAVHTVTAREFDRVPGMYSPNQHLTVRQVRQLPYDLNINSLGYRGAEFPLRKPPGEFRILVLGDSIVFGEFVDDPATLPARLEHELRESCRDVRVINAGLSGTSIISQQHVAMRSLAIEPDLALLVFSENDVSGIDGTPYWERLAEARRRKSTFPLSVAYVVARDSAIWTALMRARANILGALNRGGGATRGTDDDPQRVEQLRERYMAMLAELQNGLQQRGISLYLTAFPSHLTLRGLTSDDRFAWFAESARMAGLQYIDLYGPLTESGEAPESFFHLPWDGHPSPRGHAIAAAAVARSLRGSTHASSHCH